MKRTTPGDSGDTDHLNPRQPTKVQPMAIINAHAAGIDVGSTSYYVAIGQEPDQVKEFGCYTSEIHELCHWLKQHQITTVALESTGSYWKSLFVLLQDYELNPILVNGKFTKNVKGRNEVDRFIRTV